MLSRRRIRDRTRRETAEQREEWLIRRGIRDRIRRAIEQRQALLREKLNAESDEERDVRLQQMRELTREK